MATHIQIGDISPRIQYTGDSVQTVFTYPFPVFADADIEVYEGVTLKTLSTDYAVSGAGNSSGGTITFLTVPASGSVVTIRRNIAIQRTSDFQVAGDFQAKVINDELDYQTAALQQVEADIASALQLGPTDSGATILPDKASRSGKYLGFDANGDPIATDAGGPTGPQGPAGNMDGANNLSELTSRSTARTNLGLGSAAVVNVAVGGAGDLLRADGDGSGLTGIVSGATAIEKANIMLNAFRIEVNGGLAVQNMVDGIADVFNDQTGVDTVGSINLTYDAVNHLYNNLGGVGTTNIATNTNGTGSVVSGAWANGGGVAATNVWDSATTGVGYSPASGFWLALDYGAGNAKSVVKYGMQFYIAGLNANHPPNSWRFQGSNDGSTWTILDTQTGHSSWTDGVTKEFTISNTTAYRHYRVQIDTNNGDGNTYIHNIYMYENIAPPNVVLISTATTALSTPTSALIVIEEEDVGAVTLNTDLKAWASRDAGTTWTQITLADSVTLATGRILTGTADISAPPVGTAMKYKIETLNAKELKIHGVALQWS